MPLFLHFVFAPCSPCAARPLRRPTRKHRLGAQYFSVGLPIFIVATHILQHAYLSFPVFPARQQQFQPRCDRSKLFFFQQKPDDMDLQTIFEKFQGRPGAIWCNPDKSSASVLTTGAFPFLAYPWSY